MIFRMTTVRQSQSMKTVVQLADEAGTNQISQRAKPGLLGRWKTDLERLVIHAVADSVLIASAQRTGASSENGTESWPPK